ncbi:MAG: serine--tRNA ligase [Oscillospiraceae bacterium]|jgi:seryl-tRNA synthetase|nr:serine--tRNA ligase [Oscillospiraceae bacterium]
MLDIKIIRENPEEVKARLKAKLADCDSAIDRILVLDSKRRELIFAAENAKSAQNKVSKDIPRLKKAGQDTTEILARMNALKETIKNLDAELKTVEDAYEELMLSLPNLPDPDLVPGGKENNAPLRFFGSARIHDFEPKNHIDLCTELGLIDYPRGAKLAGNGYWIYRGMGARLEWALLNYFIETHELEGYEFMLLPHMLGYECGLTAGQFPKFKEDVYWVEASEDQQRRFMLPTAETALASIHRAELLAEAELPKKYVSYTPCFRREGGSYRSEERGMIRGHQFNKVEMFQVTRPEDSAAAFEELVTKAEFLVKNLGLKFRTVKLAAGDCSAAMARTYDIEVYIPSMGAYKEVSSVSNARDYQARRGQIRFRREETGKIEFCHTLNGSGLATSRILPAIVEQYQNADGSVEVPKVLKRYLRGREQITKDDIKRAQMKNPLSCG